MATNKDGIDFDVDALVTDVNNKLDRDLTNFANGAQLLSLLGFDGGWDYVILPITNGNGERLCVQWGVIWKGSELNTVTAWDTTITLQKSYVSEGYKTFLTVTFGTGTANSGGQELHVRQVTPNSFVAGIYNRNSGTKMPNFGLNWFTIGWIA